MGGLAMASPECGGPGGHGEADRVAVDITML